MKNKPAVSVVIPVYNAERYIGDCLESVTGQTFRDIEILCVDDGSADGSLQALRAWADRDSRIKVLTQAHAGTGEARNCGLRHATGRYVMFCDSDDLYDRNMCEAMFSAIDGGGYDIVKCGSVQCFPSGRSVREPAPEDGMREFHDPDYRWKGMLGRSACNKIFRADLIDAHDIRFPPSTHGEDLSFLVQYSAVAGSCHILPDHLYLYRIHPDSTMGQYEFGAADFSDAVLLSYRFALQFLSAHDRVKGNEYLLFHLGQDILHLTENCHDEDRLKIIARIKQDILCCYDMDDLAEYPLFTAVASDDEKETKEILESMRVAQLLGLELPPGIRLVRVDHGKQ